DLEQAGTGARPQDVGTALRPPVRPIYPTQVPVTDPYQTRDLFGAYQKGRLWSGFGGGGSFGVLRLAARRWLLLQAVHSCCLHEFNQLTPYAPTRQELGWRIEPLNVHIPSHSREIDAHVRALSPELAQRRAIVQARMECPHPVYEPTFSGFIQKILK